MATKCMRFLKVVLNVDRLLVAQGMYVSVIYVDRLLVVQGLFVVVLYVGRVLVA